MKNFLLAFLLFASHFIVAQPTNKPVTEPAMLLVMGGAFKMGSDTDLKNERPAHIVSLNSFYMSMYEITQSIWQVVMAGNPSYFKTCAYCPVEEVTPEQVDTFIAKLNLITGKHYRLPTEAEWEYAAIGGRKKRGYKYPGSDSLEEVAWIKGNAAEKTHPVGEKKPNELGLYDMAGNVWELCSDWWSADYYSHSPESDPRNDAKALFRVVRGGSWRSEAERCYSKARNRNVYDHTKQNCGFRLVLDK